MAKLSRPKCQVCSQNESKYTCSGCMLLYCSVACYKQHKESSCSGSVGSAPSTSQITPLMDTRHPTNDSETASLIGTSNSQKPPSEVEVPPTNEAMDEDTSLPEPKPLRPLTSLKWPYVPEESAYPDPLKRDDPKALQLSQFEAIASSSSIREVLAAHPQLPGLLRNIDSQRGAHREQALQRALGVTAPDITGSDDDGPGDDILALRALAEAVEASVRGGNTLGLDWGGE